MNKTLVQWADFTVNPIRAVDLKTGKSGHYCEKISAGCAHCYASKIQRRFQMPTYGGVRDQPPEDIDIALDLGTIERVRRRRTPTVIFWCSMTDLFGHWVPDGYIQACFDAVRDTPWHTHLWLTKRPERAVEFLNTRPTCINLWLGVSAENQDTADHRIKVLSGRLGDRRFVSFEPQVKRIQYRDEWWSVVSWAIGGGESGPDARPYDIQWARDGIRWARRHGVPWFQKQLGRNVLVRNDELEEWPRGGDGLIYVADDTPSPYQGELIRVRLHDHHGGNPDEWPVDMRVQETPESFAGTTEGKP